MATRTCFEDHVIVGIHVSDRHQEVQQLQQILTEGGEFIRTRLGCHDPHRSDHTGLIILELCNIPRCETLIEKLRAVPGCQVQVMRFTH